MKPILFSAPMVRAILSGTKTQTRRVVKPQPFTETIRGPELYSPTVVRCGMEEPGEQVFGIYDDSGEWGIKCPYGKPGEHLWVKETFFPTPNLNSQPATYRADGDHIAERIISAGSGWKSPFYMPRKLSRITLEITSIRVERLQDISEEDAMREGIDAFADGVGWSIPLPGGKTGSWQRHAVDAYANLWESINGPGLWDANPWVWVVLFNRVTSQ